MSKLLVFCLDALCSLDLAYMQSLPNLGGVMAKGSYVRHAEPIYPSLTYPCHVSLITGNYVDRHGVPHNEMLKAGAPGQPWYNQRSSIQCSTLLDEARRQGLSTCSISWPVTGGADFDLNMPMIVPMGYTGSEPIIFLEHNATQELLDRYYDRHAHHLIGPERSLDKYTMALALGILRDYPQPDVMLVKMCDLDTVRHVSGVDNDYVKEQLRVHDAQLGLLLSEIRAHGDLENTNIVILGDHGQADISHALNLNVLLKQQGFLKVDSQDNVVDYDAYCHSASLSAWIQLKDPDNLAVRQAVHAYLLSLTGDEALGIGHVISKELAAADFHLTGPFDFIVEGKRPIAFGTAWAGDSVFGKAEYAGFTTLKASHGALPYKDETTTLVAGGPNVRPGVVVERSSIVDNAPTLAHMLGFDLPDVDGQPLVDMIKPRR